MMPIKRTLLAALTVTAALVVGPPAAGASAFQGWTIPTWFDGTAAGGVGLPGGVAAGACGLTIVGQGQGGNGNTHSQACLGAGLSFIGPSIGQIATVIGPTIIGPAFVGNSVVSAGSVGVGP
jgi:hypothetical protein